MKRSIEIHNEIEELSKKIETMKISIEKKEIIKVINELEKELYEIKQKEYVNYSRIDENVDIERIQWLEESKKRIEIERKKSPKITVIK